MNSSVLKKIIYISIIFLIMILGVQFLLSKSIDKVEKNLNQKNLEKLNFLNNQLNEIDAKNKYLKKINSLIVNSFELIIKEKYENLMNTDHINISRFNNNAVWLEQYSKEKKYKINYITYDLPFLDYELTLKPTAFVEKFNDKIIISSGYGDLFYFETKDFPLTKDHKDYLKKPFNDKIKIKKLRNNFKSFIKDKEFFSLVSNFDINGPKWMSVKDIMIANNHLYVSYTNTQKKNCYNIKILKAKINFEELKFDNFLDYDECASSNILGEKFHGLQVGGKMKQVNDTKFIFSLGDFRKYKKPQDDNSVLGKIYEVNLNSGKLSVISKGVRNPQGIYYDKKYSTLLHTEHGPFGGDEINIQNYIPSDNKREITNFGWPIASYGTHYDKKLNPDAPLLKSHKDNGFIEPVYYFKRSPGISDISKLKTNNMDHDTYIFLTQNGNNAEDHKSMFFLEIKNKTQFNNLDSVRLNNRFRNIISLQNNEFLISSESPPQLFYVKINALKN